MKKFITIDGFLDEAELRFYDPKEAQEKGICMSWSDLEKLQQEITMALRRRREILLEMEKPVLKLGTATRTIPLKEEDR